MNNSWWQELTHFFLQGVTLKQLIYMLIIPIILIIVIPVGVKGWVNLHSPEILPHYWIYCILLFCVSYTLNGIVNSAYHTVTERIGVLAAQKRGSKEEKYTQDLFDSLTLGEGAYLTFAIAINDQLQAEKGAHGSISLLRKGLLVRKPPVVGYPNTDRFVIPESYRHGCYIRLAGKADSLMGELIAQDKHGKNK